MRATFPDNNQGIFENAILFIRFKRICNLKRHERFHTETRSQTKTPENSAMSMRKRHRSQFSIRFAYHFGTAIIIFKMSEITKTGKAMKISENKTIE